MRAGRLTWVALGSIWLLLVLGAMRCGTTAGVARDASAALHAAVSAPHGPDRARAGHREQEPQDSAPYARGSAPQPERVVSAPCGAGA